jgi:hypothetical protein
MVIVKTTQGTFEDHSGNIRGTFNDRSGNNQGTLRRYLSSFSATIVFNTIVLVVVKAKTKMREKKALAMAPPTFLL